MTTKIDHLRRIGFCAILLSGSLLVGCDDATGPSAEGDVRLSGRVTDEASLGKVTANIEGAVVTASTIEADGTSGELQGEARTNAEGRFELHLDDAGHELVLHASKGTFQTKAMAYTGGRADVRTMPMTAETHGEAEVFVEARQRDGGEAVTMADVALFVTRELGAEAATHAQVAADVAAAVVAEARTRENYVREEQGDGEVDDAPRRQNDAFFDFQAALYVASGASAAGDAVADLEQAAIDAYTDAGVAIDVQAAARQAALSAIVRFSGSLSSDARLDLRQTAEILAARATAEAIEASFRSSGATSARIDAVQQAQSTLVADLRVAASAGEIAEARAAYASSIEEELAAEIGVDAAMMASADAAVGAAASALDVALSIASSAEAVADAHATFYTSAESAARASLAGSADAELGAEVLALLGADVR